MDFKKETEKVLELLSLEGVDRRKIEKDLEYREFYVDQLLSKGGNKIFLNKLSAYHKNKKYLNDKLQPEDRAILNVLLLEVAKLKANASGASVEKVIEELHQNAIVARMQIKE